VIVAVGTDRRTRESSRRSFDRHDIGNLILKVAARRGEER
jgi:hypothetical protein